MRLQRSFMGAPRGLPWLAVASLVALAIACGSGGAPTTPAPVGEADTPPPTWTATSPVASPSPQTESTPTSSAVSFDVCSLIPREQVEALLGEPVAETVPGDDLCMHVFASGTSVTAMIQRGDVARDGFINSIAQLSTQEGCAMTASYSSGATGEPTPLPAEVEALVVGKSLLELVDTFLELYAAQCDAPLETADTVDGVAELAFFQPLDLGFIETLTLGAVVGDSFFSYTLAVLDPMSDPASRILPPQAQEWLRSLAQTAFEVTP